MLDYAFYNRDFLHNFYAIHKKLPAQKLDLMITNKTKCLELTYALIIEDSNKNKAEEMIEHVLKEFKENEEDELKNKLLF